jgi:hypothetical protein
MQGAPLPQNGADDHQRAIGFQGGIHRGLHPVQNLLHQLGVAHVDVIFQVVQNDQIRPPLPVLQPPEALPPAPGLHPDIVGGDEIVHRLVGLHQFPEILMQPLVVQQLHIEVTGEVAGQVLGVAADDDEMPLPETDLVQHIPEGAHRAFGEFPGRRHHRRGHHLPPVLQEPDQLIMERGRSMAEIMGQIGPAEIQGVGAARCRR